MKYTRIDFTGQRDAPDYDPDMGHLDTNPTPETPIDKAVDCLCQAQQHLVDEVMHRALGIFNREDDEDYQELRLELIGAINNYGEVKNVIGRLLPLTTGWDE